MTEKTHSPPHTQNHYYFYFSRIQYNNKNKREKFNWKKKDEENLQRLNAEIIALVP